MHCSLLCLNIHINIKNSKSINLSGLLKQFLMLASIDTQELQDSEKEKIEDIYETGGTGKSRILLMPKCDPGFPFLQGICLGHVNICLNLMQEHHILSQCSSCQGAKLFFVDCKDLWGQQLLKKQRENQAGRGPEEEYLNLTLCSPSCLIISSVLLASTTDCW